MKKLVLFISLFCGLNILIFSQDKPFVVKTGAGYYTDMLGWYDGPIMWLEGGYRLKTGFILNARVSVASIDWLINDGAFKDYRTVCLRQMADITFSRPVRLSGQHYLEPGVGFKLKREYNLNPDIYLEDVSGQLYMYPTYSDVFYEIGFTISLDYYYQFKNGFFLGVRSDTNIIWALGFEGLTFSPLFGFRF
jgi:hypothetical protein